jgi:hypothetical protein
MKILGTRCELRRECVKDIGRKMTKNIEGEIISAQTAKLPTGPSYGYITIETPGKKYLKLKVDAQTKYDTLEKGHQVNVEYTTLGNTEILSARKISKK